MERKRHSFLSAIIVAFSVLFVITEVKAQPAMCTTPGGISVTPLAKSLEPITGHMRWDFLLQGSATALNSVKDFVLVIHRPVKPTKDDIISPVPSRTYCEQSDTSTRINRGNCDGFPLISIPLTKETSTMLRATVITSSSVTEGVVTPSVVTGASNSETCTLTGPDGFLTGIVGPGEKGDPFQPQIKTTLAAGGKCVVDFSYDETGKISNITTPTSGCHVGLGPVFLGNTNEELKNNTNPHGITFGNNTTTCYGPPSPSPARCVCTATPCP
jgi:hypothetical protein